MPRRRQNRLVAAFLVLLWLASLLMAWQAAVRHATPALSRVEAERAVLAEEIVELKGELSRLRQEVANLGRAEEITRAANGDLQQTLTEREEEMAQLRADVSFYERLVGVSGQRRGLSVHSVKFSPGAEGLWSYQVTLVQNLNRGKVSRGELVLALEGVQSGALTSLDWQTLKQQEPAQPESFEFRYFQQIQGNVMLPMDFQPHRVKVTLRSEGRAQEQAFDWDQIVLKSQSAGR